MKGKITNQGKLSWVWGPKNVVPGTSPENCNGGGLVDLDVSVVEDTGVRRLDSPSPFTLWTPHCYPTQPTQPTLCCLNTRNVFLEVHPHSYLETLDCRGGQGSPGKSQPEKGQVCSSKSNGKDTRVRRYHRGKESGEGEEGKLEMVSVLLDANTLFRSSSNTLQIIFETLQNQRCRVSISVRNLHSDFGKGRTERWFRRRLTKGWWRMKRSTTSRRWTCMPKSRWRCGRRFRRRRRKNFRSWQRSWMKEKHLMRKRESKCTPHVFIELY